jgi:PAS domain S-box-containing protein
MIDHPEHPRDLPDCSGNISHLSSEKIRTWLSAILTSSMDGVVVIDAERHILLVNRETERMFGHQAGQLTGRSLDILIPPRLHKENRLQIGSLAATRIDDRRLRLRLDLIGVRSTGKEFLIDASVSRIAVSGSIYFAIVLRQLLSTPEPATALPEGNGRTRKLAVSSQQKNEVEKKKFSKELYDELGQRLSILKLDLDWLEGKLSSGDQVISERIMQMQRMLGSAIERTRNIASTLRPPLLDDFGLFAAIEWMAANFQKKTGIRCDVEIQGQHIHCGEPADSAIFRVAQESLMNIERHARASQVHIRLRYDGKSLDLLVQDDGIGLEIGDEDKPGCYGLLAMQERVCILGGTITRTNTKPGGLAIHASIPVDHSSNSFSSL